MMWCDITKSKQCLMPAGPLKCKSGQTFLYLEVVSGSQILLQSEQYVGKSKCAGTAMHIFLKCVIWGGGG